MPVTKTRRKSKTRKPEVCLIPGCKKPVRCHGQCEDCYQVSRRQIRKKETTWEELEDAGLAKRAESPAASAIRALKSAKRRAAK